MLKLNLPCESVLVWPTSSMPEESLMRVTSSPDEGLLVVPLVTVPLSVDAAENAESAAMSAVARNTWREREELMLKFDLSDEVTYPATRGARSRPKLRQPHPQASSSY